MPWYIGNYHGITVFLWPYRHILSEYIIKLHRHFIALYMEYYGIFGYATMFLALPWSTMLVP